MNERKESISTTPVRKMDITPAEEVRLKRLGLWYLRDNKQALAAELERVARETKTAVDRS